MWRPGFVLWGWDFSKSYFPSDLLRAPRPAGRTGYMISITDFVKDTDETGPTDFDFKVEKWTFYDFKVVMCDTLDFGFSKIENRPTTILNFSKIEIVQFLDLEIEIEIQDFVCVFDEIGVLHHIYLYGRGSRSPEKIRREVRFRKIPPP